MTDKKWLVPDTIDPAEKVCIQLEIPNDLKHIAAFWGALEQLGKAYNWEDSYADGSLTAYVWQDVLEGASEEVRTGANCMLDCDDVEDCLETSTIINVIEGDIIDNTTEITNNETNITNNETNITYILDGGDDTNVYPPMPTESEPDELCGAAHEVAREVIALVEQTVIDVGVLTLAAWLLSWLGIGGWLGTQLSLFWLYILANEIALTGVDFDVYQDQLAEALYCAVLDREDAIAALDPSIPTLRRDALIKGLESATDAQIALWSFVGSLDDTADCSSYDCGAWCYFFDFTLADGGWTTMAYYSRDFGIWSSPIGWQSVWGLVGIAWDERLYIMRLFTAVNVTSVEFKFKAVGTGGVLRNVFVQGRLGHAMVDQTSVFEYPTDGSEQTLTLTMNDTIDEITITAVGNAPSDGSLEITGLSVKVEGTGLNPFGGDNC